MSTGLYWNPPPTQPKESCISSLKRTLAKKLGQYDGSMGEDLGTVDSDFIPFLEGIIEGNGSGDMAKDAQNLINAIKKYGSVELSIHS